MVGKIFVSYNLEWHFSLPESLNLLSIMVHIFLPTCLSLQQPGWLHYYHRQKRVPLMGIVLLKHEVIAPQILTTLFKVFVSPNKQYFPSTLFQYILYNYYAFVQGNMCLSADLSKASFNKPLARLGLISSYQRFLYEIEIQDIWLKS